MDLNPISLWFIGQHLKGNVLHPGWPSLFLPRWFECVCVTAFQLSRDSFSCSLYFEVLSSRLVSVSPIDMGMRDCVSVFPVHLNKLLNVNP